MTNIGWSACAALVAGGLALAPGGPAVADDKAGSAAGGSSTSAQQTGTDPSRSGAMGAATTEQQGRSAPRTGASGQSDSTEASGRSSGTPHERRGSDTASASAPAASKDELTGRVESFDHASRTFTVAGESLKVDASTEVTRDGQKASLTDIQEGDQVRASFSGSGDTKTATRIEVLPSGAGTSGAGKATGAAPAGRGGPMGPGTGAGQGDSAGTTSGTGTGSTGGSSSSDAGSTGTSR
jgi:hypothetical protein